MRLPTRPIVLTTFLCTTPILATACGGPIAATSSPGPSASAEPVTTDTPPADDATAPSTADTTAAQPAATHSAPAAATGREPGACTGLYDSEHGVGAPSRNALASYWHVRGFGDDQRFEVLPDRTVTYVGVDRHDGGPRCFRGTVTPEALEAFRVALVQAHACKLPHVAGKSTISDRGPLTFAFRLPGLACQPRLVPGRWRSTEAQENVLEAVDRAFDTLGAPICGEHCSQALVATPTTPAQ